MHFNVPLVRDIMTPEVTIMKRTDSLETLIAKLAESHISCIVIEDGIGIVTERDIIRRVLYEKRNDKKLKVKDIMTPNVFFIHQDEGLSSAVTLMHSNAIRHLPVKDETGKVVGIISQTDIVRESRSTHLANMAYDRYFRIQIIVVIMLMLFLLGTILMAALTWT